MKENLFRRKSINKISSPEQLDDYIRVSNPGVWMLLLCVIIFLAGMCVWGIFGRLETVLRVSAISRDGRTVCYVREENGLDLVQDAVVRIDGAEYPVGGISAVPVQITEDFEAYVLYADGLQIGEWVYEVSLEAGPADGIYEAEIVTESIAPMSFLLNQR